MESKARSAMSRVKRVQEEAHEVMMAVVGAVETFSTAFSFGVINGRWQSPELLGIPVDLGAGIMLHGIGFLVNSGSEHLHNLANGAMCSYFSSLGLGVGGKMLKEAQQAAAALAAKNPPAAP